jgi:integrase
MLNILFLLIILVTISIDLLGGNTMRWPNSLHSQTEAVFQTLRAFGESKKSNPDGIRSFGAWKVIKYESHRFVEYMLSHGRNNILDAQTVRSEMRNYLDETYKNAKEKGLSRQTFKTILSALSKFEHAINSFITRYEMQKEKLDTKDIRKEYSQLARHKEKGLPKSSRNFSNRAYQEPKHIIDNINNPAHKLQALLQKEGGLRAEGVGAASNGMRNPITLEHLGGIVRDPVTGRDVGLIKDVIEKGGKATDHMISKETYKNLESHIRSYGTLESSYKDYLRSLNEAAKASGQYESGRGTHGLKHNFAQERYLECVKHGMTHEQSMQQTSLELAHFRYYETYTYTRG